MKIKYKSGVNEKELDVKNFYHDIAKLLVQEEIEGDKQVVEVITMYGSVVYEISNRIDCLKIREVLNSMPDNYAYEGVIPCYLFKHLITVTGEHDFYKITSSGTDIVVEYGRKNDENSIFSQPHRSTLPSSMYWIKKYEKLANGYADSENLNFALKKKVLS